MGVSAPALTDALTDIVGRDHLLSEPPDLATYAVGGLVPRWAARPGSVKDVSRLLALASAEGLAVAPRGSGSAMGLGNLPQRLDLVMDMRRMAAVIEYAPEDMVASVESGLTLGALGAQLAGHGQRLALDPAGGAARSVGGVLATGASGPLRFRYGTGRDLLLGVRFVQADGTITWGGAKVVKSVTGYDVPKLITGSLGTLGVIVEATLRLHPSPPATGTWLIECASPGVAKGVLAAVIDSTLEPDRVALLSAGALPGPGREALGVLVSIGSVQEAVQSQGLALGRLAMAQGARSRPVPNTVWEALGAMPGASVRLRLAGEPRRLVHWLAETERLASRLGLGFSAIGEAGSGVLRVSLSGSGAGTDLDGGLLRPLREGLRGEAGSVVVEQAPAGLKVRLDPWGPISPESLGIMKRLKHEFDPAGILNAGRFVGGI